MKIIIINIILWLGIIIGIILETNGIIEPSYFWGIGCATGFICEMIAETIKL